MLGFLHSALLQGLVNCDVASILPWGNETCDITVGVPMHICDLHLGGAKDAGHIVLDMSV